MAASVVFSGVGPEGAEIGPIQIGAMHDHQFDLCCPVCGKTAFSHMNGDCYTCETCGVQVHIFSDPEGCRILVEAQGA